MSCSARRSARNSFRSGSVPPLFRAHSAPFRRCSAETEQPEQPQLLTTDL